MKNQKELTCAYLYTDGHVVTLWEKNDADAGKVKWVEIHERFTKADLCFEGRLIFTNPEAYLRLVKQARRIRATPASLKNGSENTQQRNIAVGSVEFHFSTNWYRDTIHLTLMPEIISSPITYQPETVEIFADATAHSRWCQYPISKVIRVPTTQAIAA